MFNIQQLGQAPFEQTWQAMRTFTDDRDADTNDELWVVEHDSVYTLGQAGKAEHILNAANIPVVKTDRGGQVTWHGPGQVVVYTLVDLRRKSFGVRGMVERLEQAVVNTLGEWDIVAAARRDAPGVYVANKKIAALGLRDRKGCTYHGLSLNIDSDPTPWRGINPCGFEDLGVTRVLDQLGDGVDFDRDRAISSLLQQLTTCLSS